MSNRQDHPSRTNSSSTPNPPSDGLGNYTVSSGATWGIDTNKLYLVSGSGNDTCVLDAGTGDVEVTVGCSNLTSQTGCVARWANSGGDFIMFRALVGSAFQNVILYVRVAGNFGGVATTTRTVANGDTLKLHCVGSTVTCYHNGTLVVFDEDGLSSHTITSPSVTNTKHGFIVQTPGDASRISTLDITDLSALNAGTATFTSATGTQVNMSCGAASGGTSPYSYQWRFSATDNGTFTDISGQTSLTLADTANNLGWRYLKVTDNVGTTAISNTVYGGRWTTPIVLGGIGDSIMYGFGASTNPLTQCQLLLGKLTRLRSVTLPSDGNQAQPGAATSDWTAGSTYLNTAEPLFAADNVTDLVILLGTNDAHNDTTAISYGNNLSNIITDVFANVPSLLRVWLCVPPFSTTYFTAAQYDLVVSYQTKIAALVNGTTVRAGDTLAFQYFAANQGELQSDGIHPNTAGATSLGQLWANALDAGFNSSGGGGSGGLQTGGGGMTGGMQQS